MGVVAYGECDGDGDDGDDDGSDCICNEANGFEGHEVQVGISMYTVMRLHMDERLIHASGCRSGYGSRNEFVRLST